MLLVEVRQKFTVTAAFSKSVLSLNTLFSVWNKVKEGTLSAFNTIFKNNYVYSTIDKPTIQNIITPGGFALPIAVAAVAADNITATLPALNTLTEIGADEVDLSANAVISFHGPVNPEDPEFQMIALSKEVAGYDFTQTYDLQIDFNVTQVALAAKYTNSILYLAVASKNAAGSVIQNSATYTKVTP